jgi:hypothetical protein
LVENPTSSRYWICWRRTSETDLGAEGRVEISRIVALRRDAVAQDGETVAVIERLGHSVAACQASGTATISDISQSLEATPAASQFRRRERIFRRVAAAVIILPARDQPNL